MRTGLVVSRGLYVVAEGGRSACGRVERLLSRTRNVCVSVIPQPKAGKFSAAFTTLRVKSKELSPELQDKEVFCMKQKYRKGGHRLRIQDNHCRDIPDTTTSQRPA